MKKSNFNIKLRSGETRNVSGDIFKFSFYDCEDVFYFGAYKLGSKYIITELESGINVGAWSYYKKDIIVYLGKQLMKLSRYWFLNQIDKHRDSELNASVIESLSKRKVEIYFPANNTEVNYIIGNRWADDTSALIGAYLRPYYKTFKETE